MIVKNELATKIAIGLSALIIGFALGRWLDAPKLTVEKTGRPAIAPNESKASTPMPVAHSDGEKKRATNTAGRSSDPAGLAQILGDHASGNRLHELTDFVEKLAPGDFGAALLAAHKLARSADRELVTRLLVARWAEADAEGALAFAASHKEFDGITGDVFQQLAAKDLSGTLSRAQAMSDPGLRYEALRGVLGVMAEQDPAGALRLASSAEAPPHTEPLSQAIYRQWSAADPQAAAAAAAQESSSTGWRSPLGQVLRTWANQDPQGALNYAVGLTDAGAQSRSIGDIMRRWSEQDPGAAAGWINTVPPGTVRDAAVAAFASSVASTDLPAAVGWAQSISDDTMRTSALQRVSRRVLWRDPTNGAASLQNAGVPPEILRDLPSPAR